MGRRLHSGAVVHAEPIETVQLHPIVTLAWSLVDPYNPARHPARLERELAKLAGTPDLEPAILSLVTVAKYLDDRGRRRDADTILTIAATAVPALEASKSDRSARQCDARRREAEHFTRFEGRAPTLHRAPQLGARASEGTVTIATLVKGPRRA